MNINYNFEGRNILVTGVSSGIGRQIVLDLCENNAKVYGIARRDDKLNELEREIGKKFIPMKLDVTNFEAIGNSIKTIIAQKSIHGFVHAAGINFPTPLRGFSWESVNTMFKTNIYSPVEIIKQLSFGKCFSDSVSIVLISSVAAQKSNKVLTFYAASKGAILSTVKALSLELASKNIRCNAVSPGWVTTEMSDKMKSLYSGGIDEIEKSHPLGIGNVKDISNLILFLLSDEAKWITGSNYIIDGGYHNT